MKKPFTFSCFKIDEALQEGINEYHRLAGNKPAQKNNCSDQSTITNKNDRKSSWLIKAFIFLGWIIK